MHESVFVWKRCPDLMVVRKSNDDFGSLGAKLLLAMWHVCLLLVYEIF